MPAKTPKASPRKKRSETAATSRPVAKKAAVKKVVAKKTDGRKAAGKAAVSKKNFTEKPISRKSVRLDTTLLNDVRKFRSLNQKRVGILFSGGPAPGANAVISTAALQFLNQHWDVVGFYKGYEFLEDFDINNPKRFIEGVHYDLLDLDEVTKIRIKGGSILRTSRANPCKVDGSEIKSVKDLASKKYTRKLYNVIDALEHLGIGALISIGGDDTLKTAYYLSLLGVPVVHVPKTIDNDYFGISWTFGYFSAIEHARQAIKTYNEEVRTTDCYFILELMGRKAGWYTLGAGIASEAVRMICPEEYGETFDLEKVSEELVDLVLKREGTGKNYGVILISEGLVDKLPASQKPEARDEHGNIVLSEAKIGERVAYMLKHAYKNRTGRRLTVKRGQIGYTTRCVDPTAYDVLLSSQLGNGAFQLIAKRQFARMVTVTDQFSISSVPFGKLIDPDTFKVATRFVPTDGDFYKLAKSLEFRLVNVPPIE